MNTVKLAANGKINLSLNILGVKDSLHLIDSVMVSVSLCDTVTVTKRTDNNINIRFVDTVGVSIDLGENNTVKRTVDYCFSAFRDRNACNACKADNINPDFLVSPSTNANLSRPISLSNVDSHLSNVPPATFGADILIEKGLPVAGGLGGSSADIAAVLTALDMLFGFKKYGLDIKKAAALLGSDVPFMLSGGAALVTGIGDKIQSFNNNLDLYLVIAHLGKGVSSKDAYARFDTLTPSKASVLSDNLALIRCLQSGDKSALTGLSNALTQAAQDLCGGITNVQSELLKAGAMGVVMTGSGCASAGFFESFDAAQNAANMLKRQGFYADACFSTKHGIALL